MRARSSRTEFGRAAGAALVVPALLVSILAAAVSCGDDAPLEDRLVRETPPGEVEIRTTSDPGTETTGREAKTAAGAAATPADVPIALPVLPAHAGGPPRAGAEVEVWVVLASRETPGGVEVLPSQTVTTDRSGIGTVRVPDGRTVVRWWARSGETWWRSGLEPQDPAVVVEGWGDRVLVRVVDHRGAPVAGVGVTLQAASGQIRSQFSDPQRTASTDADGFVLVTRPGPERKRDGTTLPAPRTVAQVEIPIVPAVAAPLPDKGPGPLVLRVPECGSIRVKVAGDDLPESATVTLAALVQISSATGSTPATSARVVDGVAEFPQVGTGLRFAAILRTSDAEVTTRVEFAGPGAPGARVEVALPRGAVRPSLTGRLLSEDGAPRTGGHVLLTVAAQSDANPWMAQTQASTAVGADGRFRATFDLAPERLAGALVTVQEALQPHGLRDVASLRAPASLRDGTADLGDLRAEPAPVVVAGRALAADGSPLRGASVTVWVLPAAGSGGSPRVQRELTTATAEDGTFTIRGRTKVEGELELRLSHLEAFTAPLAFERGAADIVLRAVPTGAAKVRLLLPEGLAEGSLVPAFEGEPAVAANTPMRGKVRGFASMHQNGLFVFERLTPGTGTIAVYLPGDDETPIARIDGVEITAGGTTDRGTLDLRPIVPVATVHVTDEEGKPVLDGGVWWTAAGSGNWREWRSVSADRDGCARVPVVRPVHVLARRPGSRFAEARSVTGDVTLRTKPAKERTLTVRLADGIEIPEAPFRFQVMLLRVDEGDSPGAFGNLSDPRNYGRAPVAFPAGRRWAEVRVTESGRWRAVLSLTLDRGGGSHGRSIPHQSENSTVLAEDATSAEIVVRADADEIERVRASMAAE